MEMGIEQGNRMIQWGYDVIHNDKPICVYVPENGGWTTHVWHINVNMMINNWMRRHILQTDLCRYLAA